MMNLALELGCTLSELEERLTEKEWLMWLLYDSQYRFPTRRMELYLARIAMVVAQTMGGAQNVSINDYLIKFERVEATEKNKGAAAVFGAVNSKKVYMLGQGRKLKEAS